MAIRAVAFDIGGVLERVPPQEDWLRPWQRRLGLAEPELTAEPAGRPGTPAPPVRE
jgi:hypothetical protein